MKRLKQRALALLCACGLLLGTACGTAPAESGTQPGSTAAAMGRYVERVCELPDGLQNIFYFGQQEAGLVLIAYTWAGEFTVELVGYLSTDGGESWQPYLQEELASLNGDEDIDDVYALAFGPNGGLYVLYNLYDEEYYARIEQRGDDFEDDSVWEGYEMPYSVLAQYSNGTWQPRPAEVYNAEYIKILENDDVLVANYYKLYILNGTTGEVAREYEFNDTRLAEGFFWERDGQLAVSEGNSVALYDLTSGNQGTSLPLEGEMTNVSSFYGGSGVSTLGKQTALYPTQEGWVYANSSGLYRMAADGGLTERVADGALNSLSSPTLDVYSVIPEGDSGYYVMYYDAQTEPHLYHYSYDANVATQPSRELWVYSLEESATVRQAVNVYQRQNPDVRVKYDIGLTGEGGFTADDALKNLATQILSGDGPDVLVLDGVPMESYIRRGVLANLDDLLPASLQTDLLSDIAFLQSGAEASYAIAARFTLPLVYALEGVEQQTATLPQLAAYLGEQEYPLFGHNAENFIEVFYPAYQHRWFNDDGTLNEALFGEDLQAMKQLAELYDGYEVEDFEGSVVKAAILSESSLFPLSIVEMSAMEDLTGPYTIGVNGGEEVLTAFPAGQNAQYYPGVMLGIVKDSAMQQEAADFITCAVGDEVQRHALGDGLPVNRAMLAAHTVFPYERYEIDGEQRATMYGDYYYNPFADESEFIFFQTYWPTEQYFAKAASLWENASVPVLRDSSIQQVLQTECAEYFANRRGFDETLQAIAGRINLYAAEQA